MTAPHAAPADAFRDAAPADLLVGAAIGTRVLDDPRVAALVAAQFSVLTAENAMKPRPLQPEPGVFRWEDADRLVAFAEAHGQRIAGHTLLWHQSAPAWFFEDPEGRPLPRAEGLANLERHIRAVAGRYRGRVIGWDVVNEAIDDRGEYLRDTPALRSIGPDYVVQAFRMAREADPDAELWYNDYNIELDGKRERALRLLAELEAAGVRPDGVGIQGHWLLERPDLATIERGLRAFLDAGYPIHVTELDIDPLPRRAAGADVDARESADADPFRDGLPPEMQERLAARYAAIFDLLLRLRAEYPGKVRRITFWGVHDGATWLNNWPVRDRTNHPLPWDRDLRPKPAFDAIVRSLRGVPARPE